jgi:hypothetical protein
MYRKLGDGSLFNFACRGRALKTIRGLVVEMYGTAVTTFLVATPLHTNPSDFMTRFVLRGIEFNRPGIRASDS